MTSTEASRRRRWWRPPPQQDVSEWIERRADALAWFAPVLFAVLAVLAVGIVIAANTAADARDLNRVRSAEVRALTRQVEDLAGQNDALIVEVRALRAQVSSLGGVPVNVTVEARGNPPGDQPQPATTTTTTTSQPTTTTTRPGQQCSTIPVVGRCL